MPVTVAEREKSGVLKGTELNALEITHELMAFCPGYRTLETLAFTKKGPLPTRKFCQLGNSIYHNCGAGKPCRLYRSC